MAVISQGRFWEVEEQPHERVLILRRTDVRADDLQALAGENAALILQFESRHRDWGIVVDMRLARPRNDDGFEDAMRPLRAAVERSFARVVILVSSAVGVLQVKRIGESEGASSLMSRDEDEALQLASGRLKPDDL